MPATLPPPPDAISPSDLGRLAVENPARAEGPVLVGGRVTARDGAIVELSDAFTTVRVRLQDFGALRSVSTPSGPSCEIGDLVTVSGLLRMGELIDAHIGERHVPRRPPTDSSTSGETPRFTHEAVGQALAARSQALRAIRDVFHEGHFVEVDTPAMVPCPGLDVHLSAFRVGDAYLSTSPEYQMKRLLVGGVPRTFQLARCFRQDEQGAHHEREFLMLEWYRAFARVDAVMDDTEQVVRAVANAIYGVPSIYVDGQAIDLRGPFRRMRLYEAFRRFASIDESEMLRMSEEDEEAFFRAWVDEIEPALAEEREPIFLVDFPMPMASLARQNPEDPRYAERFELYLAGVELCNGFGELTDPDEQRARLKRDRATREARGLPAYPIDERFLAALEEGMPPSAGNALGVDRLLAVCLGVPSIGEVQPFPATWL